MEGAEHIEVEITAERGTPEFMGTDLESYGPYDQGDVAEVPKDNAEVLVNRGSAEYTGQKTGREER